MPYDVSLHAVARQPRFHVSRSSRHIRGKSIPVKFPSRLQDFNPTLYATLTRYTPPQPCYLFPLGVHPFVCKPVKWGQMRQKPPTEINRRLHCEIWRS